MNACMCCDRHQTNIESLTFLIGDDVNNKYNDKINNLNKYKCRCNCRHNYRSIKRYQLFIDLCRNNKDEIFNTIAYSMVHPLSCTCCDRHCRDREILHHKLKKPSLMQQYYGMCICNCRHIIREYNRLK